MNIATNCNQQYSVLAISNASGAVVERVAYQAYGQPTFTNAAGTTLSSSAKATRYSFTGREWDATLELHHFRARWMSGVSGRFAIRDPLSYVDGTGSYIAYFLERFTLDPLGMRQIIGVTESGQIIYKYEQGDPPPAPPFGNSCYSGSIYGPIWVPCPQSPPDDPEGPKYLDGMLDLYNSLPSLESRCDTCCGSRCTPNDCKNDMRRLRGELMRAWQDHYGRGPAWPQEPGTD